MQKIYVTKDEAINEAIKPALGEHANEHDLDRIFELAFAYTVERNKDGIEIANTAGFVQTADESEFWEIVQECAKQTHIANIPAAQTATIRDLCLEEVPRPKVARADGSIEYVVVDDTEVAFVTVELDGSATRSRVEDAGWITERLDHETFGWVQV